MRPEFLPEYQKHIKSPRWKLTCQRYFALYGKRCQACGTARGRIHVHHMTYDRFGRELLTDLKALCQPCHKEVHRQHRMNRSMDLHAVTEKFVQTKRANRLGGSAQNR